MGWTRGQYRRPAGSLQLAQRALNEDGENAAQAARELCRACSDIPSLPDLIGEWFEGRLSEAFFNRIADAWAEVQLERLEQIPTQEAA